MHGRLHAMVLDDASLGHVFVIVLDTFSLEQL